MPTTCKSSGRAVKWGTERDKGAAKLMIFASQQSAASSHASRRCDPANMNRSRVAAVSVTAMNKAYQSHRYHLSARASNDVHRT